jgi:hypothetical protein
MNTNFSVIYDGEDIANGTIDVRDLAPSLIAFADLIDATTNTTFESSTRYSLRVKSDFKTGSFEVGLGIELAQIYKQLISLFGTPDAQAIASMMQILGITGAFGLFQLIKKSKGKKPTKVSFERTERVTITFEGASPDTVDPWLYKLFQNFSVRKAVEKIVEPLNRDGIDVLKFRSESNQFEIVKEEAQFFKAPADLEGQSASFTDTRLVIVSPSFIRQNKWKFFDGAKNFFATIQDEQFITAVQNGTEVFRKGDMLRVSLKTLQWMESGKLKIKYTVEEVFSHEPGQQQHDLY